MAWLTEEIEEKYGIEASHVQRSVEKMAGSSEGLGMRDKKRSPIYHAIGRLVVSEEDARRWLAHIGHNTCRKAIGNGAWEVSDGVVRPKSLLWLDCWARTGQSSQKAKIAAMEAFEAIFGLDHVDFSRRIPHAFSRQFRSSVDDDYIIVELRRWLQ